MARFYGKVGYGVSGELVDGVWSDNITERAYYGEIISTARFLDVSDEVNDDIRLTQRLSILADPFALDNFSLIRYVSWMDSLWTVTQVTVERPRLILTLGGVYNGPRPAGTA